MLVNTLLNQSDVLKKLIFVAGNQLLMVLLGVGIGVVVLALVIIIAVVIIKKKRSPTSNVSKTIDANMPDDYVEPPNYAQLNMANTDRPDGNFPSTYSGSYEGPDDFSDSYSHYTQVQ